MINLTYQKQQVLELRISNARPSWAAQSTPMQIQVGKRSVGTRYLLSVLVYNKLFQEMQRIHSITWIMEVKSKHSFSSTTKIIVRTT